MPEEILDDHPQRLRAVLVSTLNPLRSCPDTTACEHAFANLDLRVVSDIAMSDPVCRKRFGVMQRRGGDFAGMDIPEFFAMVQEMSMPV